MANKRSEVKKLSLFTRIKDFLWKLICEADERYPDLTRIGLLISLFSVIGIAIYSVVWLAKEISFSDLCIGFSTLLAGGGVGIGARAKLEDGTGQDSTKIITKVDIAKEEDMKTFKEEIKKE